MAELEQALHDILAADANVAAVIGTRIYPDTLPPKALLPAVTYSRVSALRVSALAADTGLVWPARMQISCWAGSKLALLDLVTKVRHALQRLAPGIYSAVSIDAVFLAAEGPDLYEPDALLYQRPLDFTVAYTEV